MGFEMRDCFVPAMNARRRESLSLEPDPCRHHICLAALRPSRDAVRRARTFTASSPPDHRITRTWSPQSSRCGPRNFRKALSQRQFPVPVVGNQPAMQLNESLAQAD